MTTLLFAPETLNLAETTRMIEVARACGDRFDCQFMGYGGEYEHLIGKAGFVVHTLEPRLTPRRAEELWKADRMERGGRLFTEAEILARISSEWTLYDRLQPAAVVIGFTLSTYVSARAAGIPLVAVAPLPFTRPFFEAGMGRWPDMFDVPPIRWLPNGWKDWGFNQWGLRTKSWTRPFNRAGAKYGVRRFRRLVDLFEADAMLITNIPQITGLPELPPRWRYVGPIYARLPGDVPEEILSIPHDRPLVYFAMGSSAQQEVLVTALRALAALPVNVVAPVQHHITGLDLALPASVHVFDWLPAHKVNPLADIAVIHGGEGTVQTACASGTPFVGIGLQPEQEANIDFLVHQGMAVRLPKYGVTAARLQQAVENLLADEAAQRRAKEIQRQLAAWDGPANVAEFLWERFGQNNHAAQSDRPGDQAEKGDQTMAVQTHQPKPPGGVSRFLFRLPITLYRIGLGGLLGGRFLLLNHVGRMSGLPRQAVVEVVRHDPASDTFIIASGFGEQSQWFQNLMRTPDVTIQLGRRTLPVHARRLSSAEAAGEMAGYARRNPKAAGALARFMGFEVDGTEAGYRELGAQLPFVALEKRQT